MEESSSIENTSNVLGYNQVQNNFPQPDKNTNKFSKLHLRKGILIFFLLIFVILIVGLYLLNKFIYPVVTFLPQSLKPWSRTAGDVCNFGGCETSEINQIYNYWFSEALKNKNPDLCNNTQGYDTGDTGITSKEYSINQCKIEYAGKSGDLKVCESLPPDDKVQCINNVSQTFSKPELYTVDLCNELTAADKVGKCLATLSLNTKTYSCNKSSNKDIEKVCNIELFKFHGDALNTLNGSDSIKDKKTITVPLVSRLWSTSTETLGLNPDGTLALWLNGTRYSCKLGEEVYLRSDGPYCSSIPIYHVSKCLLQGDKVTLEYFTYNVECHW